MEAKAVQPSITSRAVVREQPVRQRSRGAVRRRHAPALAAARRRAAAHIAGVELAGSGCVAEATTAEKRRRRDVLELRNDHGGGEAGSDTRPGRRGQAERLLGHLTGRSVLPPTPPKRRKARARASRVLTSASRDGHSPLAPRAAPAATPLPRQLQPQCDTTHRRPGAMHGLTEQHASRSITAAAASPRRPLGPQRDR